MKYAIVESGGKQFRAVEGSTIEVDLLPVEPGKDLTLDQVLLLVDGEKILVGTPSVKGAQVKASVVDHFKGPKLIIFKYQAKKRIRVKTGHRQTYTRLMINKIEVE
jgi:large subunit ribosomal protein L21